MVAVQSDWGDPGFAGDYPALSTGTAPSAPGKRAKRTFNKQQHALQHLVAETVVLQPRIGAGGQSDKPPHRTVSPAAGSKPAESVAEEPVKPGSPNKKRKRKQTNAAVPTDQQASAAAADAGTSRSGAAEVTSNGTGAAAASGPVKPKRQRNKFKAHLAEGTIAPVLAGPNAAHVAAHDEAKLSAQPQTLPAAGTRKQRNGKQRSGQTDAKAAMTAADGISVQAKPAHADAMHDSMKPHSGMCSSSPTVADEDQAGIRAVNGSAKTERKRKKADKQGRTARAESSAAAERPSQGDGSRPKAASGSAAAANGTAAQTEASPVEVPGSKKKRKLAAADAATPAARSREVAAHRADGSGRSQEPSPRHTDGAKPASKAQPVLDKMRERLQGGRFRWLNEQMYSVPGEESFQLMQGDPDLYQQYHEGFRQQTAGWPRQPVDVAIDWLRGKPAGWRVADFGCGDARLARTVQQEVHSFDLVATAPGVVACNMAAVPLDDASIDAAIFCLALMGTDYGSFLQEAQRALRKGGWLWIAEVRSRFAGMVGDESAADGGPDRREVGGQAQSKVDKTSWVNLAFQQAMRQLGFKLVSRDAGNKMFVIMQFRKSGQTPAESIQWPQLKACVYKRR